MKTYICIFGCWKKFFLQKRWWPGLLFYGCVYMPLVVKQQSKIFNIWCFKLESAKNQLILEDLKSICGRESENMNSWGSLKFLETSTKWKLFLGGTILPSFSFKMFMVPKILQIKEFAKCRPRIYWPEFKNAIIQDWLMQMCWN